VGYLGIFAVFFVLYSTFYFVMPKEFKERLFMLLYASRGVSLAISIVTFIIYVTTSYQRPIDYHLEIVVESALLFNLVGLAMPYLMRKNEEGNVKTTWQEGAELGRIFT